MASGIEVLRIAFRLGVYVHDVSQNLEAIDTEASDSWAYVVYGLTAEGAQKELDIYTRDVSQIPCISFKQTAMWLTLAAD